MSRYFYPRVLTISLAGWVAFAILAALATSTAYLPGDLAIARWVQSVSWGPLASSVPWINALSGASQVVTAVLLIVVVAALNRRALRFAVLSALAPALYIVLNLLFHKPRPLAGLIKVTEHPASYSFPSGHATLVFTVVGVLLLAVGLRYFGRILLALATAVGVAIVLTFGIERIYVGAHYAYSTAAWAPVFAAIAGASAALTWLLFVALSINLSRVLMGAGWIDRSVEVLILLTAAMVISILLLMPGQGAVAVAIEILGAAALVMAALAYIPLHSPHRTLFGLRVFGGQAEPIFLIVGAVSLLIQNGGGLYWVAPALLAGMVAAIIGAWVVLVEAAR